MFGQFYFRTKDFCPNRSAFTVVTTLCDNIHFAILNLFANTIYGIILYDHVRNRRLEYKLYESFQ